MDNLNDRYNDRIIKSALICLLVICLIGMLWLYLQVILLSQLVFAEKNVESNNSEIKSLMDEILYLYDKNYINEYDVEELENMALTGFSAGFNDKYGYYLSPEDSKKDIDDREEKLVGIGVEVVFEKENGFYVVDIFEDSPAEEVGIQAGDYITGVNDLYYTESTREELLEEMSGEEGTDVRIKVLHEGTEVEKNVIRHSVKNKSVKHHIIDDICYIRIRSFTEYTDEEFKEIVEQCKLNNIDKYIFDLRRNHGGLAETVIDMVDYIVPEGDIAKFILKDGTVDKDYKSDSSELNARIVILVNDTTASASELFTQSLRDYNKATVVGVKTFGKGTVITTYGLSNGGTITLSTAKYYTKSGYEIEENGITPDFEVELTEEQNKIWYRLSLEEDSQMQKAIEILEK